MYTYICPTKPETPWLRNCPQFAVAKHHKWDVHTLHAITGHESARHITSSLYAAISSSFPLPFTQACAKWFQIRMWVLIEQHLHPMQKTKKLFSLLFDRRMHKNATQPALLSVSSAHSSTARTTMTFCADEGLDADHPVCLLPYPPMHSLTCTARLLAFWMYEKYKSGRSWRLYTVRNVQTYSSIVILAQQVFALDCWKIKVCC